MKNIAKLTLSCLMMASMSNVAVIAKDPILFSDVVEKEYEGDLPFQVIVSQTEIESNINSFNSIAAGGGLLGGVIASSINKSRAKKAERIIIPIRDSIIDFDGDEMSMMTAQETFKDYFSLSSDYRVNFSKDNSRAGKSSFLDNVSGDKAIFVEYTYDFSKDFDALRLVANITIAPTAYEEGSKPEKRLKPKRLLLSYNIITAVNLSNPSEKKEGNVSIWAADNGKLARDALSNVFGKSVELTKRAITLNDQTITELNNKNAEKVKIEFGKIKYKGRVQKHDGEGLLIWSDGYIYETKIEN